MPQTVSNEFRNQWYQKGLKDGENKGEPTFSQNDCGDWVSTLSEKEINSLTKAQLKEARRAYREGFNRF